MATPLQHAPQAAGNSETHINQATAANSENTRRSNHDNDHHRGTTYQYGLYYGDPWWGNSYWNGQNYTNGNFNDATYTPDGSVTNAGTAASDIQQPAPPVANTSEGAASAAAQLSNAVDESPALVEADNNVQLAQVAYDKERDRVLAALTTKPDYQQALARRHDAMQDLHQAKAVATTSPAVIEAATTKLDASDEVTKMQEQAVATDPAAQQARERLAEVVAHRDELRAKLMSQH